MATPLRNSHKTHRGSLRTGAIGGGENGNKRIESKGETRGRTQPKEREASLWSEKIGERSPANADKGKKIIQTKEEKRERSTLAGMKGERRPTFSSDGE